MPPALPTGRRNRSKDAKTEAVKAPSADAKAARRAKALEQLTVGQSVQGFTAGLTDLMGKAGFNKDDSPETRLRNVMIAAKEKGSMTAKEIFSVFDKNDDGDITKAEFKTALETLDGGSGMFDVSEEELNGLVRQFDKDGDGDISMQEFRDYCHSIDNLAWKAEKHRFENPQDQTQPSTAVGSRVVSPRASASPRAGQALELIFEGEKLFWRVKTKLLLAIYESVRYKCLVVTACNEADGSSFAPLFLEAAKVEINTEQYEEKVTQVIQAANQGGRRVGQGSGSSEEQELRATVRKEFLANYVLNRLKLPEASAELPPVAGAEPTLGLQMLAGDTATAAPLIENPGIRSIPSVERKAQVDVAEFAAMNDALAKENAETSKLTASAAKMQNLISMTMQAFTDASAAAKRRALMSYSQNKYVLAVTRTVIAAEVAKVQARLLESPTYVAMEKDRLARAEAAAKKTAKAPQGMAVSASAPALLPSINTDV